MFGLISRKRIKPAAVPEGCRVYAIGDIHGRSDLLDRLLGLIRKDAAGFRGVVTLVFIGDYVDRGRDSKGVIDILLEVRTEFATHFLCGNHDRAMLNFLADPGTYPGWRNIGGADTLLSYGVAPPDAEDGNALRQARDKFLRAVPGPHMGILNTLEMSVEIGDYYFVHAGVRPGVPLDGQTFMDMMWIRDEFLNSDADFGKIIVHGHSPLRKPVRKSNRLSIDTGAYSTGKLTAAMLEGTQCKFLQP